MDLGIIILAAGQGTRMRSNLPKVMHTLAGMPLLGHVIETARELQPAKIAVVYGHGGEQVKLAFDAADMHWAEQAEQLGTGHAVQQAMHLMIDVDRVLVLYGDVPLIGLQTLNALISTSEHSDLGVLTMELDNPQGYGRIIRNADNKIQRIVEQKDANEAELAVREINTGIMVFSRRKLSEWLSKIGNSNAQGEYYLTDAIELAVQDGVDIASSQPDSEEEVLGVNNRAQLAHLERFYQQQQAFHLMERGLALADPSRFDLRGELQIGKDVFIDVNAVIEGKVVLGDRVGIGPNCVLKDCSIGQDTQIQANCVIENASVGENARIGPFARLRPDAHLSDKVHVGNFVEIKKSIVGTGSKVNHLSYIGDSRIGSGVNVGAGTITCNYDGANKHQTEIGDNVFVGSNSALVAPIKIGKGATIGAGSTLSKEVPEGELTVARARQISIKGWQRPVKKKN